MRVSFDFDKKVGAIRAMHAVGQPPHPDLEGAYMHYLTEAHIPFCRLHDFGGMYGGMVYVDIPNLFRDFDADENDPASYDFGFTDVLIEHCIKAHCEPIYRLGIAIENYPWVKAYRTAPPKDFAKWARVCEHIIRHYNEGWANGFSYGITYWEVWNEPDCYYPDFSYNCMWTGTPEQYYALYETTAKHLKKCFGDTIKIGGPAACGFYDVIAEPQKYGMDFEGKPNAETAKQYRYFMDFVTGFLDHVQKTDTPLDFFSHHSYMSVEETVHASEYIENELLRRGLCDVEIQLNEWNNAPTREKRGTSEACAKACAMMLAMQYQRTDILCYYDARIGQSVYGGLFNPITWKPFCTYYAFKAFGELYTMKDQIAGGIRKDGLYAVGAAGNDGRRGVLFTNIGENMAVETNLPKDMPVYRIDENHFLTPVSLDPQNFTMDRYDTLYFGSLA